MHYVFYVLPFSREEISLPMQSAWGRLSGEQAGGRKYGSTLRGGGHRTY